MEVEEATEVVGSPKVAVAQPLSKAQAEAALTAALLEAVADSLYAIRALTQLATDTRFVDLVETIRKLLEEYPTQE